jgi:putative ABC transport system permease protein
MLKQYLLTALRNFRRNKISTFIHMIGLIIGISAAVVIFLIVRYDFSFDTFHNGKDRIYRIVTDMSFSGESFPSAGVPGALPDAVRTGLTGIENVTEFHEFYGPSVDIPAVQGKQAVHFKDKEDIVFADDQYFKVFSYRWLAGDPGHPLIEPNQVILTSARAQNYFPGVPAEQVLGRSIVYNDSVRAIVTGVVADLNHPSDLTYQEFVSFPTLTGQLHNSWTGDWGSVSRSNQCFVRLSPGTTKAQVDRQLVAIRKNYAKDDPKDKNAPLHTLQPLSDVHFNVTYGSMGPRTANKTALYGLLATGIFLLLLACINYVNLTTAQVSQRSKEIGIRKTMGSTRRQLMTQFLGETFCVTLASTILAAALTPGLLKLFARFTPPGVAFHPLAEPGILIFLLILTVVVSLLAGLYPARILAGLRPVLILKNQPFVGTRASGRAWLRRTLTVFQFVIAQVFILATLLVTKQISYALHKDLGYRLHAILIIHLPSRPGGGPDTKRFAFEAAVSNLMGIERTSLGNEPPGSSGYSSTALDYNEGGPDVKTVVVLKLGDTNFIRVYNLQLLAGQNLHASDTTREFLINETYCRLLGFRHPGDAIGHYVERRHIRIPIVGVIKDFNQASLHSPIKPLVIGANLKAAHMLHVALWPETVEGTSWKKSIAGIQATYKTLYPDEDFNYYFFDDSVAKFYQTEQDTAALLAWATGLSILISCLGLLGLVLFTTRIRRKEIGIRKVLGSSALRIATLLSGDFLRLLGLAFLIAVPLSYVGMRRWLDSFADRTTISWWVFAAGGGIILVTALITLSFQTLRAANANPVESLRSE